MQEGCITDETARFTLGFLVWILVMEIITGLLFFELPQANREALIGLGGTIVGALVSSLNFYNKTGVTNDRAKDDVIHSQAKVIQTQAAAANPDINAISLKDQEKVVVSNETNTGTSEGTPDNTDKV